VLHDERRVDWEAWQAEKQASHKADMRSLANGEKSREDLSCENGLPARIAQAALSQDAWDALAKF